jgi:ABC-type branched-subunit amino acid transport system substrate-binding protein
MPPRLSAWLLLAAVVLGGCQWRARGLRIITLTDLTGPQATFGQGIRIAAGLAVEDYREALLDAGWRVELTAFDAHHSAHDLPAAVSNMAFDPDVVCAVVHTGTEETFSAAQIFHSAGIPTIAPVETSPLPSSPGLEDTIWLSADDRMHGTAAAEWAVAAGQTRFFLLTDPDAHAKAIGEGFLLRAEELGGWVAWLPLSPDHHPSEWIPSFQAVEPHLVFFSGSSVVAGSILRDLEALSFHGSFFFAESEGEDRLAEDFTSETISLFFSPAVEYSEKFEQDAGFAERYHSAYNADPPELSALGYDAAAICLQSLLALDSTDAGPSSPRERVLTQWHEGISFRGITGEYSTTGGRPRNVRIFVRNADSAGSWSIANAGSLPQGTDSAHGRPSYGTSDPLRIGFRFPP